MDNNGERALQDSGKSELACEFCKKRKAKCDRTLPRCALCAKTTQSCVYPATRLKPGPKLNSHTRERKRRHPGNASPTRQHHRRRNDATLGDDASTGDSQRAALPSEVRTSFSTGVSGCLASLPASPVSFGQDGERSNDDDDDEDEDGDEDTYDGDGTWHSQSLATTNFVRAISLTSLIHPSHERRPTVSSGTSQVPYDGFFTSLADAQSLIVRACEVMNISVSGLQTLTDLYFDNMSSFSLFHKPTFWVKIQSIKNLSALVAILASMASFAVRFRAESDGQGNGAAIMPSADHFHRTALRFVDDALREDTDGPPSLTVLQAMVLSTFNELTLGVSSRGWRLLGTCVRIAYEQRLHLVDYEVPKSTPATLDGAHRWSAKEEKRRCWWAIWEMDVFASTVRRLPLAIDWSMNETYLPISDEAWFSDSYRQSCFLDPRPGGRWKMLKECGNESSAAWLIVISSLMREAQVLARGNLQGVRPDPGYNDDVSDLQQYFRNVFRKRSSATDDRHLSLLIRSLQRTISAMPESLAYHGEVLTFGGEGNNPTPSNPRCPQVQSARHLDTARYSIYLMTQLARFQMFHHFAFGEVIAGTICLENCADTPFGWSGVTPSSSGEGLADGKGLGHCLEAADNIAAIMERVPAWHVRYVNPFLASTIWMAAGLQVLRKVYALNGQRGHDDARFAILRLNCHRFAGFWNTPPALLERMDSLEESLRRKRQMMAEMETRCRQTRRTAKDTMRKRRKSSCTGGGDGEIIQGQSHGDQAATARQTSPLHNVPALSDCPDIEAFLPTEENGASAMTNMAPYLSPPRTNAAPASFLNWGTEQGLLDDLGLANSHATDASMNLALQESIESHLPNAGLDWLLSDFARNASA